MIRRIENVHILFWLIKDICWCLVYKELAVAMIVPTLIIGILVTYFSRKNTSDFIHNLSVVFWIAANSSWMITEFLGVDHDLYGLGIPGKWIAAMFFVMGIALLIFYYSYRLYKKMTVKKSKPVVEELVEQEL